MTAPKRIGIEDAVKCLGYVPREDLRGLYSGANLLEVYCSSGGSGRGHTFSRPGASRGDAVSFAEVWRVDLSLYLERAIAANNSRSNDHRIGRDRHDHGW